MGADGCRWVLMGRDDGSSRGLMGGSVLGVDETQQHDAAVALQVGHFDWVLMGLDEL